VCHQLDIAQSKLDWFADPGVGRKRYHRKIWEERTCPSWGQMALDYHESEYEDTF